MALAQKYHSHKILNIAPCSTSLQGLLSKTLGISKMLAQVLINRGIKTPQEADKFLNTKIGDLLDPYSFSDMRKAVGLIKETANKRQKVMIFGDYDVDGVTSLALLKGTLSGLGLEAAHYIPHRVKEGYGLNKDILRIAKEKNIKLLVTVDCGTSSISEIKELMRQKINVIVTDHHELSAIGLPPADAVLNPKIKACGYLYKDLAGVGVVYKLCQALTADALRQDLDLVSLGTIADMVPLTGENRVIVREGLTQISQTKRPGLKALMQASGLRNKKINSTFVSYILSPRINASGRMDTADTALDLLMTRHIDEATELARALEAHNRQRQKIEGKIMEEAQDLLNKINFKEDKVMVIAKEDWHQGVLGIVAAKLADKFYRPAIVISLKEGLCRGSGRSIKNFHLFEALKECRDSLDAFGGHSHAVGLVIDKNNIEDFKNKINRLAGEKLHFEDLVPSLDIDMELNLADLDKEAIEGLEAIEPFGRGNSEPLFYTRNLKLKGPPQVLGRDTLKFWAGDANIIYPVIGFGMGSFKDSLLNADSFDLVYFPRIDDWQEDQTVILEVREIFFK